MRRALALLLLAVPLSACGGTSAVKTLDPLAQATGRTTSVAGAHFTLTGSFVVAGKRVAFGGPGEIADHGRAVHLHLSFPMDGKTTSLEAVGVDGSFYVRGGLFAQLAGGKWVRVRRDAAGLDLSLQDPSKLLDYLQATTKVTKVGSATVRGAHTTHYRALVQRPELRNAPIDVWVGDDGLVRRVAVKAQHVTASLDLFDFGDVSVTVPPDSEALDLSNMLGGG